MKKILILTVLVLANNLIFAQENPKKCNTTNLVEQELLSNPDYVEGRAKSMAENSAWLAGNHTEKSTINIPVVVHIVYKSTHANIGSGTNISNAQIEDAIRILNEDFSKTNPDI